MPTQWHPLFAELLRPLLEGFYEVLTNVSVGDVPREADVVLLRRTTARALPFRGLWRHLTTWNVLEYKGPSVSARLKDIDLLIELGLGVHRRLNEERGKAKQKDVPPREVSFWYLANDFGRRFRKAAGQRFGSPLQPTADGIWVAQVLERPVFLVSGTHLPVEPESVPLHLLGKEAADKELELARLVLQQPSLWEIYGPFLGGLHSSILTELQAMAKTAGKTPRFKLKPLLDWIGLKEVIDQVGVKRVIDEVGIDRVLGEVGKKKVLTHLLGSLTPAERAALKKQLEDDR